MDLDRTDDGGMESMRLVGTDKSGEEIICEITYWSGDPDSDISAMKSNLKLIYPDLQEKASKNIKSNTWERLYCEKNKEEKVVYYKGYYTTINDRMLLVSFKFFDDSDPLIDELLSGIKTK